MFLLYRLGFIVLATKWFRVLSLGGIDKIRNHLVANPIFGVRFTLDSQLNSRCLWSYFNSNQVRFWLRLAYVRSQLSPWTFDRIFHSSCQCFVLYEATRSTRHSNSRLERSKTKFLPGICNSNKIVRYALSIIVTDRLIYQQTMADHNGII